MRWQERKQQLKTNIIEYFKSYGADKAKLIKCCEFISKHGEISASIAENWGEDGDGGFLEEAIAQNFSPQHREVIKTFCDRYTELELEARQFLESQRTWKKLLESARDDFEYEDFAEASPKAEIIIAPDKIIVRCFEFVAGFKERLPKGGKYLGSGSSRWEFPLTARGELETLGLPIVKYPDVN